MIVNFMTGHIVRFAETTDSGLRQSFDQLFGPVDFRARISGLVGEDREDELVRCYCDAVKQIGSYEYVCPAIVLDPEIDRTQYHLIYATRSIRGLQVFKEVEKKAAEVMEEARGVARQRKRTHRTGQLELLGSQEMHNPRYFQMLRARHAAAARAEFEACQRAGQPVSYDHAWALALSHPLVWENDLKGWIAESVTSGCLRVAGLSARQRVPKPGAGHELIWLGPPRRGQSIKAPR